MGTTPVKGMRYPDLSQLGMGPDDFNKMTFDLDGAYTSEDANRKAAAYRTRASIRNAAIAGSAVSGSWLTALYDTPLYDTLGTQVNLGANNDRITCKQQGLYLITFGMQINISANLGTGAGAVILGGISKGISTTIPDPNFSVRQYSMQYDADSLLVNVWTTFQMNVNDFVTSRIYWGGAPAGPMATSGAMLSMFLINPS